MLKKLLKYDLKYMIKNMIVFYALLIFFALLYRVLGYAGSSVILSFVKGIVNGILIGLFINVIINTLIRSWLRFRDSLYKDESYLTHTLPVTKNDLYNSKFLEAMLFLLLGFIIILLGLFIAYYSKSNWDFVVGTIKKLTYGLDTSVLEIFICFIVVTFLELFNTLQAGFLGIVLGYRKNNNKLILSVMFGFLGYTFTQGLLLLLIYIIGLFNSSIMAMFGNQVQVDGGALRLLAYLSMGIYVLIIAGMNILSRKVLNKGVNVE